MRRVRFVIVFGCAGLLLGGAGPAAARDYFGVTGGYVAPLGTTADFSGTGYTIEARWRHHNKGRSAFELEFARHHRARPHPLQAAFAALW